MSEAAGIELRGAARLRRLLGQVRSRQGVDRDLLQVLDRDVRAGRETETPGDRAPGGHDRGRDELQTEDRDVFRVCPVRRHPVSTGDRRLWSHVLQELRGSVEELSRVRG